MAGPIVVVYDNSTGKYYRGKVDAAREITMGSGSSEWNLTWELFNSNAYVVVGDGIDGKALPHSANGKNLTDVFVIVDAPGTGTGTMDLQVRRKRAGAVQDVLSTKVTLGASEYSARDGVIDTSYDDNADGDSWYVDIDSVHGTTPPKGCVAILTFT